MKQVARLALQLFDELRALHQEGPRARALLEAAALLHDIGFSVSESSHHKHSRDLILKNPVPGFLDEEVRVIACVARYHRRAEPSKSHALFAQLSRSSRRTVQHLSALLRVADGLDLSHQSNIDRIRCEITDRAVRIRLAAARDVGMDLEGAERKKGLFESLFDRTIEFEISDVA